MEDPTDVPTEVVDYVAGQVGAADASTLKGYMGRRSTRFEHTAVIMAAYGYRDFADAEVDLGRWLDDRAWTTGEGPKALFDGAILLAPGAASSAWEGSSSSRASSQRSPS